MVLHQSDFVAEDLASGGRSFRIAIVDTDRTALAHLRYALEPEGFDIDVYSDPALAFHAIRRTCPDLALVAVSLGAIRGTDFMRMLAERAGLPVVLATESADPVEEVVGLRLGAEDVVAKDAVPSVVAERLRKCIWRARISTRRTDPPAKGRPVSVGALVMDPANLVVTCKGKAVTLTLGEFRVLLALARYPGQIRSRAQLLEANHDAPDATDERTVDSHVKRIRRKLRAIEASFEAIRSFYGVGYHFEASGHGAEGVLDAAPHAAERHFRAA